MLQEAIQTAPVAVAAIDWTNIILAAIGAVTSSFAVYFSYKSRLISESNATALVTVNKKVDGMSSDLVAATAGQNLAEGQLKERDAERLHQSELPPVTDDDPLKVKLVKGK